MEKQRHSQITNLQFLKLGGSLITDKTRPHTARLETIARLAEEIAAAYHQDSDLRLILGHGSGSFGHTPASKYQTRLGIRSPSDWKGFIEVWFEAQALNRLVMDALVQAGLPVIAISPAASVMANDGGVITWDIQPISMALQAGLIPVVYGDVVFDQLRGGTILSTEALFRHLAMRFQPYRILLAGVEPGVWEDYPACTRLAALITPEIFINIAQSVSGSAAVDVTGGMASKVAQNLELVEAIPELKVWIFSGDQPGSVYYALRGEPVGTLIKAG